MTDLAFHRPAQWGGHGIVMSEYGHENLTYGGWFIPAHVGKYLGMVKYALEPSDKIQMTVAMTERIKFDNEPDGFAREI